MSVSRRTRLSAVAAVASGVLVVAMAGTALAADRLDAPNCSDLDLQDAQAALDAVAPSERHRLDTLCASIPAHRSVDTEEADDATPATTPAAVPDEDSADKDSADEDSADKNDKDDEAGNDDAEGNGDRDCADFDSQADAQAAFEESSNDEERLDADDDGIACEDRFDTEGQQVAVYPKGGVATGGAAQA
jgi:hypothetical protein